MLIKGASVLLGDELEYIESIDIRIQDGMFYEIRPRLKPKSDEELVDCAGLLVIPGFVNCHTHVGDSIAKDVSLSSTVDGRIHPVFGIKPKVLKNTRQEHLASFMRNSCISMMQGGITTFVDFREGGICGVQLLKQALSDLPLRGIILGRLDMYHTSTQIRQDEKFPADMEQNLDSLINECDGIGISGANENSTSVLRRYSLTQKLRAIHSAETQESVHTSRRLTGKTETSRALCTKPDFLVHMTYASAAELASVARRSVGIVVCPRANASLAEGIPDVILMQKSGCTVSLGTDNVMINSPDMFREMDYLWKVTMGIHRKPIDPKEILKMATVNGGKVLHMNVGSMGKGMVADCIFLDKHALDLEPMHSPHASIVHRASQSSIRAVMIGGEIVHGGI
ncbi:MAG: amidohydrolase family protein [Thaumarchaeota archaeon]|nr:amidohydrolase family protein [Nitrososphaerota archaeon]